MRPMDNRGLAIGILGMMAIIVIAALLYTLFDPAVTDVISMTSGQTTTSEAQGYIDTRETIWQSLLFYPVVLAAAFIIARAFLESRRPG